MLKRLSYLLEVKIVELKTILHNSSAKLWWKRLVYDIYTQNYRSTSFTRCSLFNINEIDSSNWTMSYTNISLIYRCQIYRCPFISWTMQPGKATVNIGFLLRNKVLVCIAKSGALIKYRLEWLFLHDINADLHAYIFITYLKRFFNNINLNF